MEPSVQRLWPRQKSGVLQRLRTTDGSGKAKAAEMIAHRALMPLGLGDPPSPHTGFEMVGEPQHRHGWLCWRRLTPSRGGRSSEVKPSPRRLGDFFGVFEFSSFFGDVYFLGGLNFLEFFELFKHGS